MAKVITLLNRKGGCSKTSTAFSLAVELSKKANTICIDLDDQANLTSWAGITELKYEFADYLLDRCDLKEVIQPTKVPNLYILPTAAREGDLRNYADLRAKEAGSGAVVGGVRGFCRNEIRSRRHRSCIQSNR